MVHIWRIDYSSPLTMLNHSAHCLLPGCIMAVNVGHMIFILFLTIDSKTFHSISWKMHCLGWCRTDVDPEQMFL